MTLSQALCVSRTHCFKGLKLELLRGLMGLTSAACKRWWETSGPVTVIHAFLT